MDNVDIADEVFEGLALKIVSSMVRIFARPGWTRQFFTVQSSLELSSIKLLWLIPTFPRLTIISLTHAQTSSKALKCHCPKHWDCSKLWA